MPPLTKVIAFVIACVAFATLSLHAQDGRVRAVEVYADTQADPAQITLHWNVSPFAVEGTWVYRRAPGTWTWNYIGAPAQPNGTTFVDTNVSVGVRYEYKIYRQYDAAESSHHARGYTIAGIEAPLLDQRGKVVLLLDSTQSSALASEIAQFKRDLTGDGWLVLEESVAPSDTVVSVRSKLQTLYSTHSDTLKAAILLGRIPVPYSGDIMPDGHTDHQGAWPSDTYYADLTGTWTDTTVNRTTASQSRNHNVPGDGKFDDNQIPEDANIAVGRIDMANMSGFGGGADETELLRNYLRKNHEFRHRLNAYANIPQRGLIDDHFGLLSGEAPASVAWTGFTAMFGPASVTAVDWFTTLQSNAYLWAYGCGPGTFTSASGIGTSTDFKTKSSLAVFNAIFGSYFGDWDSPTDSYLRAPLAGAADSLGLVNLWANRPGWHLHGMTLGETIGDAYLRTLNNPSDWSGNFDVGYFNPTNVLRFVHTALLGDPTLRLHPVKPPVHNGAVRTPGGSVDAVELNWLAPAENDLVGYHIYRSDSLLGSYTRLTATPLNALTYTDNDAPQSHVYYQVRAVVLSTSASGTYHNAGQAVFFSIPVSAPASAPIEFEATASSDNTINLSWNYTLEDADSFRIERRLPPATTWETLATLDATVFSFSDTPLLSGTEYEYRIFSVNSVGDSSASGIASATTATGEVLVLDSFTDGGVTNGADALDVNWSKTGNTFAVVQDSLLDTVAPHNVAEFYISTSNKDEYLYFPLPSEQQLNIGEALRLSFKLRHTGTPRNDASSTGFSIAHTPSNSPWNNAANKEYWVRTSYGNAGALGSIRKTLAAQILNTGTELKTGTTSVDSGTDVITAWLEVKRNSGSEMLIRYQLNDQPIQEIVDSTDIITAFNRIFFRFRSRTDAENPGEPRFRLDDVKVEKVAAVNEGTLATISISNLSHGYNANGKTVTVTTVPEGLATTVTYNGSVTPPVNAGTYTVVATVTEDGYWGDTTETMTIATAPLTVTAAAKEKTEGAADPALTYSISAGQLYGGDSFTGSLTRDAGEFAGTYTILKGSLSAGANYTLTYNSAELTIISPYDWATAMQESFPNSTASPVGIASSAPDWKFHFSETGAEVTSADYSAGNPTAGSSNSNSHPDSIDSTAKGVAFMYYGDSSATSAFMLWRELASPLSTNNPIRFIWWYLHQSATSNTRLAIRIGSQWYLHTQGLTSAQSGGAIEFSTKADQHIWDFSPNAENWASFSFTPGSSFAVTSSVTPIAEALPSGNITAVGFYNYIVNSGSFSGVSVDAVQVFTELPPSPLQTWREQHFSSETLGNPALEATVWGSLADPDGDGVINLLEYALGGDPQVAGLGVLPQLSVSSLAGQDYLTLTVPKNENATDLSYSVETSTDLQTWQSGAGEIVVISETATELVVRTAASIADNPRRFLRLRVIAP